MYRPAEAPSTKDDTSCSWCRLYDHCRKRAVKIIGSVRAPEPRHQALQGSLAGGARFASRSPDLRYLAMKLVRGVVAGNANVLQDVS